MKPTSAIATTATLSLAFSALSFLPISGGKPALAERCAQFYIDKDARGKSFTVCLTNSKTIPAEFNDRISSISIPPNKRCILFTDAGFSGLSREFSGSGFVNLPPNLDNRVSSIQCTNK